MDEVNLQRIEQLVRGEQPEGLHEELFIIAFKEGLSGNSLMVAIHQVSDIFSGLDHKDKNYFTLGYAMGQKVYLDSEEKMIEKYSTYTKKTTH